MTMTLTKEEVDRRVAVLRRLKATLADQRMKFQTYLKVLDAEKASIEEDRIEILKAQVELEEELVVGIHAIQKVIDPLEAVLQQSYQGQADEEIVDLRTSLSSLRSQVQEKSRENRGLLSRSMALVDSEIRRVRPQIRSRNPFTSNRGTPVLVDITT